MALQSKTLEMFEKVKTLLIENDYMFAEDIAKKCHLSSASIYRLIRIMRMEGIGVQPTPKGYVLSEFAQKRDDVHFLRRLNGRRTSDFIAVRAATPFLKKRWSTMEDKRNLGLIIGPLQSDLEALGSGLDAIKALEDRAGL